VHNCVHCASILYTDMCQKSTNVTSSSTIYRRFFHASMVWTKCEACTCAINFYVIYVCNRPNAIKCSSKCTVITDTRDIKVAASVCFNSCTIDLLKVCTRFTVATKASAMVSPGEWRWGTFTEVKARRRQLVVVLGWVTTREDFRSLMWIELWPTVYRPIAVIVLTRT